MNLLHYLYRQLYARGQLGKVGTTGNREQAAGSGKKVVLFSYPLPAPRFLLPMDEGGKTTNP